MSSGRQAGGKIWVSYSNCDKHICTEDSECNECRIAELEAQNKRLKGRLMTARVELLGRIAEMEEHLENLGYCHRCFMTEASCECEQEERR